MTTITSTDTAVQTPFDDVGFDDPQIAAPSFLARYSDRIPEPTVCGGQRKWRIVCAPGAARAWPAPHGGFLASSSVRR